MKKVVDRIKYLADIVTELPLAKRVEFSFLVAARMSPLVTRYKLKFRGANDFEFDVGTLWKNFSDGNISKIDQTLRISETSIPDCESETDRLCIFAQNAAICFVNVCNLILNMDSSLVGRIIENYFDTIDYVAQDSLGISESRADTDELVINSNFFATEFEHLIERVELLRKNTSVDLNMLENERISSPFYSE
ncbi:hypothetical protein [Mesorhizobium sp. M0701]|uniref:hypothetical protein n=1 Tax=Mesorhizobium sp. M0701 TaxID=2956989 RepID=UPI00333808F0